MNVSYVGSAHGSELVDHGMKDLEEEVSEGFTRLESGIEVWKRKDMRDRCCRSVGSLRAESASSQAGFARDEEEEGAVGKCLLRVLKMPSSMITSGGQCDSGSLVLDLIKLLELVLIEKVLGLLKLCE